MGIGNQCRIEGCDSPAEFQAHMKLWYRGLDGQPISLDMAASPHVCGKHRPRLLALLSSEKNKEMIAEQLIANKLGAPDFSSMTIDFQPIHREKTILEIGYEPPPSPIERCGRIEAETGRCTNPAQWQVALAVRNRGWKLSHTPHRMLMNLCVCHKHKQSLTPEDFTRDASTRATLMNELAKVGVPMPDWKLLQIEYQPMKHGRKIDPLAFVNEGAQIK